MFYNLFKTNIYFKDLAMEKKRNILHEIHSFMSDNDKYDRLQESE